MVEDVLPDPTVLLFCQLQLLFASIGKDDCTKNFDSGASKINNGMDHFIERSFSFGVKLETGTRESVYLYSECPY